MSSSEEFGLSHNPEVVGSNPSPATTEKTDFLMKSVFFLLFEPNCFLEFWRWGILGEYRIEDNQRESRTNAEPCM